MISLSSLREKKIQKWIWAGAAAFVAVQLYFVQEMLAALAMFSILFAVVASILLVLFLLDRGFYRAMLWAEPAVARAARFAGHGWAQAEEFRKRQLHRQHSETAP